MIADCGVQIVDFDSNKVLMTDKIKHIISSSIETKTKILNVKFKSR